MSWGRGGRGGEGDDGGTGGHIGRVILCFGFLMVTVLSLFRILLD